MGASGSGKSTWAHSQSGARVVSADNFFMLGDGSYEFDPHRLPDVHQQCLRSFLRALEGGEEHVIVDNTNTTLVEIAPYYALAEALGYTVEVRVFTGAWDNVHGVPEYAVAAQRARIRKTLSSWPRRWVEIQVDDPWGLLTHGS